MYQNFPPSCGCVLQQAGWRTGQDCSGHQDHHGEGDGEGEILRDCLSGLILILCLVAEGHQQESAGGPGGGDQHWGLSWQGWKEF